MRILKIVGVGIGFLVVFVGALIACVWLKVNAGEWVVGLVALTFGGAWVATPEARQIAAALRRTLEWLHMPEKVAAIHMQRDPSRVSRQLACEEKPQLLHWLECLGADFRRRFFVEMLREEGGVLVIEDDRVARIMRRLDMEGAA